MPSEFHQWCVEQFGRIPVTFSEIWYFSLWFERDKLAASAARLELDCVMTVDDFIRISEG